MTKLHVIILAGGLGTRMLSPDTPKVLMQIAGQPMLFYSLQLFKALQKSLLAHGKTCALTLIVNEKLHNNSILHNLMAQFHLENDIEIKIQKQQNGTGDAVLCGRYNSTITSGDALILYGDTPLLQFDTILRMLRAKIHDAADIVTLLFHATNPAGYGRAVLNSQNNKHLLKIVEHKDCSEQNLSINLCNSGIILCDINLLDDFLNKNATLSLQNHKENYLTDIISYANSKNLSSRYISTTENEALGANDYSELAKVEKAMQDMIRHKLMRSGVKMLHPESIFFHENTKIAPGATLHSNIIFDKDVIIASGATIYPFCHIAGANIEANANIGPFANIRAKTHVQSGAKIGSFVETKEAEIGANSKAAHLAYLGNVTVQHDTNIGAGVVICNYDGKAKHQTTIGHHSFIGSNSSIVAPVQIGNNAFVAASSAIVNSVPDHALAIARANQINKPDWRCGSSNTLQNDSLPEKSIEFYKMHGLRNDFIILQAPAAVSADTIKAIADRKSGIGCDQLLIVAKQDDANFTLSIFNADGSPANACGNGTRCAAFFAHKLMHGEQRLTFHIAQRKIICSVDQVHKDKQAVVTVNMGKYTVTKLVCDSYAAQNTQIIRNHRENTSAFYVNIGNEHIVIFTAHENDFDMLAAEKISNTPKLMNENIHSAAINVTFASLQDVASHRITVQTYERNVGKTEACGSAACATYAAFKMLTTLSESSSNVGVMQISMLGGNVDVFEDDDENILMRGDAAFICRGTIDA